MEVGDEDSVEIQLTTDALMENVGFLISGSMVIQLQTNDLDHELHGLKIQRNCMQIVQMQEKLMICL